MLPGHVQVVEQGMFEALNDEQADALGRQPAAFCMRRKTDY
ncbi:hypothetical protein [Streptomyces sp. NPDC001665]